MGQRSKEVGPGLNRVDHDGRAGRKNLRYRLDGFGGTGRPSLGSTKVHATAILL